MEKYCLKQNRLFDKETNKLVGTYLLVLQSFTGA